MQIQDQTDNQDCGREMDALQQQFKEYQTKIAAAQSPKRFDREEDECPQQ